MSCLRGGCASNLRNSKTEELLTLVNKINVSRVIAITVFSGGICSVQYSFAQLATLADQDLRMVQARSLLLLDQYKNTLSGVDTQFTRITLNAKIETITNVDRMEFGRYKRTNESLPADISFRNFALGYIGSSGEIKPFKMNRPFFEYATQDVIGKQAVVGIRFGFGESIGILSSDIDQLTGNIDVQIKTNSGSINWVRSKAELITPEGSADDIRATHIGIPNGEKIYFAGIPVTTSNCKALWVNTCFELSKYRSIPIGKKLDDGSFEPTEGVFLSFQGKEGLVWGNSEFGEETVKTVTGAFFNIPSSALTVTFDQANKGISRARTEYIDRGLGRWGMNSVM